MANSLPWSVKGVDPRTRDAAKAAARRAGMTLGEWLDHKIRDEAEEAGATESAPAAPPEQLDIAALSERLARLSSGQMDTSPQAAGASVKSIAPGLSRNQIDAALAQAAAAERITRESSAKTAGALDSIARWIEKTENRLASGERVTAERQERATAVIADAIKTMGERLAEIERSRVESEQKPAPAPARAARPALSRDGLAAAVTDIRTRQRILDSDGEAAPAHRPGPSESRIAALRQDLQALSARIDPANEPAARERPQMPPAPRERDTRALESMIADLGAKLDRFEQRDRIEPILKPLARIESEVARLSQDRSNEGYARFELEVAHLAAKVDALAARGSDRAELAPMLRDISGIREMLAASDGQDGRLGELSHQVSTLAAEVGRLRETQADGRDLRSLSLAIEDVREAIISDRAQDRFADPAPLVSLSRQVEGLAGKIESLPAMRPEVINAQVQQLFARLNEIDASGRPASDELARRIEALVIKLEDVAERQPNQLADRIDALQQRIETLAEHGPAAVTKQIEALAGRIENLAASSNLAQLVNEKGSIQVARVDLTPVEEMLRGLAEKIDEAGRPGAESDSFDALEQQIAGIASRLDEAAATRSAETGIERTLQDLVRHLQTAREDTAAAAERAARAAMADMQAKAPPPTGNFAELSSLLSGLRESHASSGRETQDAIGAMHRTLETIISRLASLEAEFGTERQGAARPVTPPRPAAPARPAMPAAKGLDPQAGMSAALEDRFGARLEPAAPAAPALDMPLEPGSGRPRADATATGQDAQSVRQNLIAAARRSAKAATDAAAAAPAAPAETKGGAPGGRLKEIMEKRRRPILLGLAAIVLAMGTAHVVTGALRGDKAKPTGSEATQAPALSSSPAPAQAAPEAPAPESPAPKPGKDQSSMLAPPDTAAAATLTGPAVAAEAKPDIANTTGSTPTTTAALPPISAPEPVQTVTGIGDLPNNLGTPGMRKAALAGDARAVYELASRAADGSSASRDPKLALRLFERAAVAGLPPAQFRLANMFEKGIGTARDLSLARVWYARAAERGNAKAMHNLAVLYAEGVTGKPDYASATEWFRRAAEFGVRDSQYNLAILLGRGLGAPADLGQSYLWFAVSAAQGDDDAGRKRDEVAGRLSSADLSTVKAAADAWKAKPLDPAANEVAAPAKGWDASPTAAAQKPAKPQRT